LDLGGPFWIDHAPFFAITIRDVLESDTWDRFEPSKDGPQGGVLFGAWSKARQDSSRVLVQAGASTQYRSHGYGVATILGPDGAWWKMSDCVASAAGWERALAKDPRILLRLATWPERAECLLNLGTWRIGIGQVIHLDRENGIWAEPR
jgi:hypothetical protein